MFLLISFYYMLKCFFFSVWERVAGLLLREALVDLLYVAENLGASELFL